MSKRTKGSSKHDFSDEIPTIEPGPQATTVFTVALNKFQSADVAADILSLVNTRMTDEFADLEKILDKRESHQTSTGDILGSLARNTLGAVKNLTDERLWHIKPVINVDAEICAESAMISARTVASHWD